MVKRRRIIKAVAEIGLLGLFLASLINEGREGITRIIFLIGSLQYILAMYLFNFIGYPYYLSSACACMVAIVILTNIKNKHELHIDLSIIFFIGILLNLAGWLLYEAYIQPWYYNGAFGLFYIVLIMGLLIRKGKDGMGYSIGGNTFSGMVRAFLPVSLYSHSKDKEGLL